MLCVVAYEEISNAKLTGVGTGDLELARQQCCRWRWRRGWKDRTRINGFTNRSSEGLRAWHLSSGVRVGCIGLSQSGNRGNRGPNTGRGQFPGLPLLSQLSKSNSHLVRSRRKRKEKTERNKKAPNTRNSPRGGKGD